MEQLKSRKNPLVAKVRKLSSSRTARRQSGLFLCDGIKMLEEAIRWGADIEILFLTEGTKIPPVRSNCRIISVTDDLMAYMSRMDSPEGALFLCGMPRLEPPENLYGSRYVILDELQDPGNVGTIWRTADAFGADGVFLLNGCADPYNPKTVRASMGAVFRMPLWETNLDTITQRLDKAEIPILGTSLGQDTVDIRSLSLKRAAVVIGNEGNGISERVQKACSRLVRIPMTDRCESLNAAVAAAVVLWEMAR